MIFEPANSGFLMLAVHLSDGVLSLPFCLFGFIAAAVTVGLGVQGIEDREIPRLGVLTAAFFVASQVHLPLGVSSVHLLLNGLLGVILGPRAVVAIAIGLGLQALLFAHGGITSLGINICIYSLPAVVAAVLFRKVRGWPAMQIRAVRILVLFLVSLLILATIAVTVFTIELKWQGNRALAPERIVESLVDPVRCLSLFAVAAGFSLVFDRFDAHADFTCGAFVGAITAYLTVVLVAVALRVGGLDTGTTLPWAVLLLNSPVIAVEAIGLGFMIRYLGQVKPQFLGMFPIQRADSDDSVSGKTSSQGISH